MTPNRRPAPEPPALAIDVLVDPVVPPPVLTELERSGVEGAWVTETVRDPFLTLAAHAGATRSMTLGTGVAIAFARSPMTLALSAHDLQRASGGRLILGLGSQVRSHITRRFSMPWSAPAARMREYVLALRAIWAAWNDGRALRFDGRFYTHTLMTPFFDPGPTGHPAPPVILGGLGERMMGVAAEVADGFLCPPLTSQSALTERILPRLGGRRDGFTVCGTPFLVTGRDQETMARVEAQTRKRIAFYASTPEYRAVLDLHGWAGRGEQLTRLARAGEWDSMARLVDDEMLHSFAVVGEPERIQDAVRARWAGRADRVALYPVTDPGPEIWPALFARPDPPNPTSSDSTEQPARR